jgi:alpha,alpha-trehalase
MECNLSLSLRYGFVPNGGRLYYTSRSQPPLLTQMVEYYYNCTSNLTLVETVLPALSREYEFWMANRSTSVGLSTANYYSSPVNTPRPEAYFEDVTTAAQLSAGTEIGCC